MPISPVRSVTRAQFAELLATSVVKGGPKPISDSYLPTAPRPKTPAPVPQAVPPPARTLREAFDAINGGAAVHALAELLPDNMRAWVAKWESLKGATKRIDCTYFTLERDVFGMAFVGLLLRKQREGVPVRLLTDSMSDAAGLRGFKMHHGGRDYIQELVRAGAKAAFYHPIHTRLPRLASLAVGSSNHQKILVADSAVITGGRNIAWDYYADPQDDAEAWRDTDVLLHGRALADAFRAVIDKEYERSPIVDHVTADRLGNLIRRDAELLGAAAIMDLWLAGAPKDTIVDAAIATLDRRVTSRERKSLRDLAGQLERFPLMHGAGKLPAVREQVVEAKAIDTTAASGGRVDNFTPAMLSLIASAKERVVIQNPYVMPTEDMLRSLEEVSKRGVEIMIVTNSPMSTDSLVSQAFFLDDWAYVLARIPTARIVVASGSRKLHSKVTIVDGEASIVSSYNLDFLSRQMNSEAGAVMWSKEFAQRSLDALEEDIKNPANGFIEYDIQRDEHGRAVLLDGEPIPTVGPEWHVTPQTMEQYRSVRAQWRLLRKLPPFASTQRPPLSAALPNEKNPLKR